MLTHAVRIVRKINRRVRVLAGFGVLSSLG